MFVKTLIDHVSISGRTYPAGSVVETDHYRLDELVNRKHGEAHPGPASEAPPTERERAARPETATPRGKPERATSRQ